MADEHSGESLGTASLRVLAFLILTVLVTVLIVLQQRGTGAFVAEFSATHPQEADRFLSGLLVADLLTRMPADPLRFAAEFALRYPGADGGAPPLYGLMEGAWLALLAPSTPAALLLPALLAALLVVSAGWATARWQGPILGVAVAAVLIALPLVREATIVLSLDLPVALLAFWAALAFGRFLRTARRRWALLFAGLGAAALLTGPTALALVAVPPLAVLAGRRWELFRGAAFWWAFGPVALLGGVMLVAQPPAFSGLDRMAGVARGYGAVLWQELGPVVGILAVIGALFALARGARRRDGSSGPLALTVLALAAFAMLGLIPGAPQPLALLPLMAPALVLAGLGGMGLFGLITSGWTTVTSLIVGMILLLFAMPALLLPVRKPGIGMDNVAQAFLAREAANPLLLAAADRDGEGALVAAVAQRDRAGSSFVLRGARVFAGAGADGGALAAGDVMGRLEALEVAFIGLDTSPAAQQLARNRQLLEAITAFPDRFQLLASSPRDDGTGEARLYAVAGQGGKVPDRAAVLERLRRAGQGAPGSPVLSPGTPDAAPAGAKP